MKIKKIQGVLILSILFISSMQFGIMKYKTPIVSSYEENFNQNVISNSNLTLQQDNFNDADSLVSEDNLNVNIDNLEEFTAINSSIKVSGIDNVYTEEFVLTNVTDKIIIEDPVLNNGNDGFFVLNTSWICFTSFIINETCSLTEVQFQLYADSGGDFDIYITNATSEYEPDITGITKIYNYSVSINYGGCKTIDVNNTELDIENTFDNIFFIGLLSYRALGDTSGWSYKTDSGYQGDNLDESMSYIYNNTEMELLPVDFVANITISSLKYIQNYVEYPITEIPLSTFEITINGELIDENGFWSSPIVTDSFTFGINETFVLFNITIDYISITYSKTINNLNAILSFVSEDYVLWDINAEIDEFEPNAINKFMNFTIDPSWEALDITNNSESITFELDNNVIILDSENSTNGNWQILARSINFAKNLSVLFNDEIITEIYVNETILLRLELIESVTGNGIFDLYNPVEINDELKLRRTEDFGGNNYIEYEINLGLIEDIPEGKYRIQAYWSNSSSAGISNLEFTLLHTPINPEYTLEYTEEVVINENATINITIEDSRVTALLYDYEGLLKIFTSTDNLFNITYEEAGIYNFTILVYHEDELNDTIEFTIKFTENIPPNIWIWVIIISSLVIGSIIVIAYVYSRKGINMFKK